MWIFWNFSPNIQINTFSSLNRKYKRFREGRSLNSAIIPFQLSQSTIDYLDFEGLFVVIIGNEKEIIQINPRAIARLQLDKRDLNALEWFSDICIADKHPNFNDMYNVFKFSTHHTETMDVTFENALRTSLGEIIDVKWHCKGLYANNNKHFDGILCIGEDISSQKNSEEILKNNKERYRILADKFRQSEAKYRQLIVSTNDFVWEINDQNHFIHLSHKVKEIMGYNPHELIDHPIKDYAVDLETKNLVDFSRFISSGQKIQFQGKFFHKSGKKIFLEFRGSVGEQHGVRFYYGVCSDVTDNVLIQQHNREEENERTRQQKNESLGLLAGGIAHDFNNILAGILGTVNLLQIGCDDTDEEQELLKELEDGTLRARDLVKQLLTFSKGEPIVKKTASISEIIEKTASFTMRGSKCVCKYYINSNLPAVNVDSGQISQVINNLILNAIQAMVHGGIIEISCDTLQITEKDKQPLNSGEYIKIAVKDHGPGIPKELQPRIFEPYFTTKKSGNGLGLATCYKIINAHGGFITMNPSLNHGTEFLIYLPTTTQTVEKVDISDPFVGSARFQRLLLLEDDTTIHRFLNRIMPQLHIHMDIAFDGESAIQKFRMAQKSGTPYDVLLFDLVIPGGMGGKETIRQLRLLDPQIFAIVSSGYSNDPILSNYEEYGFNQILKKPYTINDLKKSLTKTPKTQQISLNANVSSTI